jgi:hypothetical protein
VTAETRTRGFALGAVVLALSAAAVSTTVPEAQAADVADIAGYQVKLRLDDSLVDASGALTPAALDLFGLSDGQADDAPETEQSVYADTADGRFADAGWSVRLRHKEGEDSYDLTYKRRSDLADNSLSQSAVDAALADARDDNFDSSDDNYEAQVNASYNTSTLDFSTKKSADCDDDCAVPDGDEAVDILDDKLPGKLEKATGTTLGDAGATASQVVTQRTWPVSVATEAGKVSADLEVTAMSGGYFVELTAETGDRQDAASTREALTSATDEAGVLRHGDAFKTGLILGGTL